MRTPLVTSPVLDAMTGGRIFLKAETLQRTGSFKFRGAYNKLASIPTKQRGAASSPSRPAIMRKAWRPRRSCSACRPSSSCRAMRRAPKRERTAALGAEVVLYDRERDDREAIAERDRRASAARSLVPPYDDALIIAGQGTVGLEIVEDLAATRA